MVRLDEVNGIPEDKSISVILPTRDEEDAILPCLESIARCEGPMEILVVDGGSRDRTLERARDFTSRSPHATRVLSSDRTGRAAQMNFAAKEAGGAILWFVHADSRVPQDATLAIRRALSDPRVLAGSFRFEVDSPGWKFRLLETAVATRTRWFRAPYGDQGLFLRTDVFRRIGGYADQPILEDLDLVRRVRKLGRMAALPQSLVTAGRRWEEHGFLATTWLHTRILIADRLGVEPETIANWRRSRSAEGRRKG